MRTNRPHWIHPIFLFCENIHFWYKMSVEIQPEISGSVGLFYKINTTALLPWLYHPSIPECKAKRWEGTLTHTSAGPRILCYRSRGSNQCPGQNTPAPPGTPKLQPRYICQETCLLTKTQWLTLLNLVDVGRKDLTLKGAALYSTMRPRHRAFYKTLPFRENVAGNPKKYG